MKRTFAYTMRMIVSVKVSLNVHLKFMSLWVITSENNFLVWKYGWPKWYKIRAICLNLIYLFLYSCPISFQYMGDYSSLQILWLSTIINYSFTNPLCLYGALVPPYILVKSLPAAAFSLAFVATDVLWRSSRKWTPL